MWVFTQDGFISAVDNNQVHGKLAVRARDKKSLELLSEMTGQPIVELKYSDYEYRVYVTRDEFTQFMVSQIDRLTYGNFKNRIWQTRGDVFHDACSEVWETMLQVADTRQPAGSRRDG